MTSATLHTFPTGEIYAPGETELEHLTERTDRVWSPTAGAFVMRDGPRPADRRWLNRYKLGALVLIVLAACAAGFLFLWLVSLPFRLAGVVS